MGRLLLERVINNVRSENGRTLILTVNRNNSSALHFDERQGFVVSHEEKVDIGGGYVMDDFILKLSLN